jgi:hypothetical protein
MSKPLVDEIRDVFKGHPDHFDANKDVYTALLTLIDQLERNHGEFKVAHQAILSNYPKSPTMSRDEMDNIDIAFLEVLEPLDNLMKLFGLWYWEPEGYTNG